jgi:hypothetical protein
MTSKSCHSGESRNPAAFVDELRHQSRVQIIPIRIFFFNQLNFPVAFPFLDLFLARDGGVHIFVNFKPHQRFNTILFCESVSLVVLVLPNAADQIARYTDVERAIACAGQKIYSVASTQRRWIPAFAGMTNFEST